jgi:hypothetical protein
LAGTSSPSCGCTSISLIGLSCIAAALRACRRGRPMISDRSPED